MQCSFHTMHLKEIDRIAEITVCVPKHHNTYNRQFPVLYMHDGQNIVDPNRSYSGSTWRVKESFESDDSMPEVIVVGISSANDARRLDEYNPFRFEFKSERLSHTSATTHGGKGEAYIQDIITMVKPFVDTHYPTDKSGDKTAMIGSSLGGLISLYAGIAHGDKFTRIASLSGAFFVSQKALHELIKKSELSKIHKLYLDTGDSEVAGGTSKDYLLSNRAIYSDLKQKVSEEALKYLEIKDGKHHENDWADRFKEVVRFLFE